MITKGKQENRISGLDVLYRVDPKQLSIKLCYTSTSVEQVAECTTTFESFSYDKVVVKSELPEKIGKLPAHIDGLFYFGTEEEARDFIKQQIGL